MTTPRRPGDIDIIVDRGTFTVPAAALDDDHEVAVHYARGLPPRRDGGEVSTRTERMAGGDVLVRWRLVRTRVVT